MEQFGPRWLLETSSTGLVPAWWKCIVCNLISIGCPAGIMPQSCVSIGYFADYLWSTAVIHLISIGYWRGTSACILVSIWLPLAWFFNGCLRWLFETGIILSKHFPLAAWKSGHILSLMLVQCVDYRTCLEHPPKTWLRHRSVLLLFVLYYYIIFNSFSAGVFSENSS